LPKLLLNRDMTKKLRNYIINTAIAVNFLMLAVTLGVLIFSRLHVSGTAADNFFVHKTLGKISVTALFILFAEILVSFAFLMVFKSIFKKTSSPEPFFFIIALAGFSLEGLRAVVYLTYIFVKLYPFYMVIPRIVYFGKLMTALTLVISGLFATGFSAQKQNTFLGLSFIFSFLFAFSVPIDFSVNNNILLPGNSTPYVMQKVIYSLYILAFLNYFAGAYINRNKTFMLTGIGTGMTGLGIEMLFFLNTGLLTAGGFVILTAGLILSAYSLNRIYSWI